VAAAELRSAQAALGKLQEQADTELAAARAARQRCSDVEIGRALAALFGGANIQVVERDGRRVAVGISLKRAGVARAKTTKALGRMTPRRMENA
jgi:hypothetical protein